MTEHRIVAGGSTLDADRDTIRQRYNCPACDVEGSFTIRPAKSAAALLAWLDHDHRADAAKRGPQ